MKDKNLLIAMHNVIASAVPIPDKDSCYVPTAFLEELAKQLSEVTKTDKLTIGGDNLILFSSPSN